MRAPFLCSSLCATVALVITRAFAVPSPSTAPLVDLGYETIQGSTVQDRVTGNTHSVFLGVRYAAPPTGRLRFSAPKPPAVVPGITPATTESPTCLQGAVGAANTTPFRSTPGTQTPHKRSSHELESRADTASEDCLFLNVYVPGNLGEKKDLPVVVWIHGGGYVLGSAAGFDGNDLLRESDENVIAVIIQYRLGIFGFLPGQQVKDHGSLNAGLLDQQFALQWVQQHITKFGGDPKQVTIWGESAGAGSVLQHVVANGGKTSPPLFRSAITSSLYLPPQYHFNDPIPQALYDMAVSQTNCSNSANTFKCLQDADLNALQAANNNIGLAGFIGTFVFVPVVDGTFITKRPTQLLQEGKLNTARLLKSALTVTNAFEGTVFVNQQLASNITITDFALQLYPDLSLVNAQGVAAQYAGLGDNAFQASAIYGESIFICPTYFFLQSLGGRGFKAEFAVPPALHGDDVAYYFPTGSPNNLPPFANPVFDLDFSEMFLDFSVGQNPNKKVNASDTTPAFPLWNGSNEMLFNRTDAGDPDIRTIQTSAALLKRCQFWHTVTAQTAQ